ncbi:MAG: hypothetical protein KAS32_27885 [Candidatus Peribacteraceae bacterium]|nr:hypothetical protein [Candidatus Peribacteraceae bacterium]
MKAKASQLTNWIFVVDMQAAHEAAGVSAYRVAIETGLEQNTVKKYASGSVEMTQAHSKVLGRLCDFYNVDFNDVVKFQMVGG